MESMRLIFFGFLVGVLAASSPRTLAEDPPPPAPEKSEKAPTVLSASVSGGNTLTFLTPEGVDAIAPLKLPYFDITVLGFVGSRSNPFIILTGLPCDGCTDNKSVFMVRARGATGANGTALTFHYPGVVRDRDGSGILHQSRLFWGKCLASKDEGVVIFAEEKEKKRKFLQKSLFIAEVPKEDETAKGQHIREELLTTRLPAVSHTQHFIKGKKCFEVKGYDRLSSSLRKDSSLPFLYANGLVRAISDIAILNQ